jgi:hypothetical protein
MTCAVAARDASAAPKRSASPALSSAHRQSLERTHCCELSIVIRALTARASAELRAESLAQPSSLFAASRSLASSAAFAAVNASESAYAIALLRRADPGSVFLAASTPVAHVFVASVSLKRKGRGSSIGTRAKRTRDLAASRDTKRGRSRRGQAAEGCDYPRRAGSCTRASARAT